MLFSPNLRGALFMVVAMSGFTLNDAITKVASESMNMAQVMLIRGAFASLFVGLLAWQRGALALPGSMLQPMVAIRVIGEAGATASFLIALAHLPIANVSAVLQALPLAVTMGAALVFKEGVGWRRWLAIAIGFAGVLIIVRPGFEGFSIYSLLALACVACCAVRDLATKRIPQAIPTLLVSTTTALAMTMLGAALLLPMGGWTPMTGESTAFLALAAVLVVIGYQFIIMAMRVGDISFIAPFRYTALLWSILLGLFIFGDVPDLPMILGASIIVCSGLYALYRERIVGRRKTAAESAGPDMAPDGI
ncbi:MULTISPECIES: DMT family transporter [unclassified Mesorhizobium]|uniref:DMT family transporter n=1 Tax=unclassified Mesorhizobium TaxID=325217 RepID=UPI0004894C71|nr:MULTISPECIES: DMT family transporter [unclassified Mesorhizobium]RWB04353.1 MAG: DMT family transporter [Mesorhizobium sp.]RWB98967.1 MAG: DMT family transporter [Mesorhizobium sp.]RWO35658.1 MAG: DMT family transporter [Mesorhizobium sp.]RWO57246.1 MAG: DMT family transporter [Mesorhizobium sp.]RWP04111.1 MAG: DMT family transporter [Mesorhizobium sp.]